MLRDALRSLSIVRIIPMSKVEKKISKKERKDISHVGKKFLERSERDNRESNQVSNDICVLSNRV
jgi:hypothetical protein